MDNIWELNVLELSMELARVSFLLDTWAKRKFKAETLVCFFVYFALIQSTFRLFKGQQYLNNMLRINK